MKKFLVLYVSTSTAEEQMKNATPEQGKQAMEMWMAWAGRVGKSMVDLGAPLGNSVKLTQKGPAGDGNKHIGGFSIIAAESRDQAVKLMEGHPHFHAPGAHIEVHEFQQIPGM